MARSGIIGNWQQTKYVSRETSEGLGISTPSLWYETTWQDPVYTWNPETNVVANIYQWIIPAPGAGNIQYWLYPDDTWVRVGKRLAVVASCLACWNINNNIATSDNWDSGITQLAVNQTYRDYVTPPGLYIPIGYRNGVEPLSAFTMDDGGLYWYDTGNLTNFSATFQGELHWSGGNVGVNGAPAIEWGSNGSINTLQTSGSYRGGRAYHIIDWYFVWNNSL